MGHGQRMGRVNLLRQIYVLTFSGQIFILCPFHKEAFLVEILRVGSFGGRLKTCCAERERECPCSEG